MIKVLEPKDIGPGGAYEYGHSVSIEEATRHQLELNRAALADPNSIASRVAAKAAEDVRKIRERKARRRAKNPYDFS